MDASKLKEWAEAQGHTVPLDPWVQEMLLAHERSYGRTHERGIDRQRAKRQLHTLIDRYHQPFPDPKGPEYPAVKELRTYVQFYQKMQRIEREKALAEQTRALRAERDERIDQASVAHHNNLDDEDLVLEQKRSRTQSRSR